MCINPRCCIRRHPSANAWQCQVLLWSSATDTGWRYSLAQTSFCTKCCYTVVCTAWFKYFMVLLLLESNVSSVSTTLAAANDLQGSLAILIVLPAKDTMAKPHFIVLSPSSSPCQPVQVIWQSLQKAIREENRIWLQNQCPSSWGSAQAQVGRVGLASRNTGRFWVGGSHWGQRPIANR